MHKTDVTHFPGLTAAGDEQYPPPPRTCPFESSILQVATEYIERIKHQLHESATLWGTHSKYGGEDPTPHFMDRVYRVGAAQEALLRAAEGAYHNASDALSSTSDVIDDRGVSGVCRRLLAEVSAYAIAAETLSLVA